MTDAMTSSPSVHLPHHHSHETLAADRGRGFGRAQRELVRGTVDVYTRIFSEDLGFDEQEVRARGAAVEQVLRAYRPALCDELEGVAAGAGVASETLYAINARTELLSGGQLSGSIGGECTTLAILGERGGSGLLGQTWDFNPALRRSRVLWTRRFADGSWATTFTEAGLLAKIGTNSHGLALSMNFMSTDRDDGVGGVPIHVLVRVVLEEATTLEHARELIEAAPASGSACLTVAARTRDGRVDAIAFERWPGGVGLHAVDATTRSLAHTNHFITPIAGRDTMRLGRVRASTELRYAQAADRLDDGVARDVTSIADVLSSQSPTKDASIFVRADETRPWLEQCATLATVVMEVPSARLWLRVDEDPALPLQLVDVPAADA